MRDPDAGRLAGWQDRLERPWGWFAGACQPNRDTRATLAAAGFDVAALDSASLPAVPALVRPAIRGELLHRAG